VALKNVELVFVLVNLTPHPVMFFGDEGPECAVEPSGVVARVSENSQVSGSLTIRNQLNGHDVEVEVVNVMTSGVEGLSDSVAGTLYIVSRIVAEACPHRSDLVFPVDLVRREDGSIVGCKRLGRLATVES
jgi:hypothetical protein